MKFTRRVWPLVFLIIFVISGAVFLLKHNEALDWMASRGYNPSSLIDTLASDTTMTPYAKRLFYANRPAVQGKQEFNQNCTDPSEQVAVLGCFAGNRLGIFIYDVADERLNGIEQVTAAHEMLHQAYQRLGKREKTRINGLLQQYHDLTASDKLKDKIASYKQTEPDQLLNEMHSIFGTEAPDLPAELEEYYKRYFTDRSKVLALHQRYQSEFDDRIAKIGAFDDQLTALKAEIEADKLGLEQREADLHQRRSQMDIYLANNNVNLYNAAVPGFNSQVAAYRNMVDSINRKVEKFNSLLAERNALAVQERELEAAIDSALDTVPRQ